MQDELQTTWQRRIAQAKAAQKPSIPIWLSNLAFAGGQFWQVYDRVAGQMRHIQAVDPSYQGKNLLTANRIGEYRDALLGELDADDDRPQLLVAQESDSAEEIAKALNQAAGYAWDHEWGADDALTQVYGSLADLGTAAIRCRRDANYGQVVSKELADESGAIITEKTHPQDWAALDANGTLADGSTPKGKDIREGRTIWQPYTAIQILPQPGVNHENNLRWFVLADVISVEDAEAEYGVKDLTEDSDIASTMGLSTGHTVTDHRSQGSTSGRLKGSVWRYLCFEEPCPKYPEGQIVVCLSGEHRVVKVIPAYDYKLPNGEPHSGVVFFHWRRLLDRFFSQAWIEATKDPQRAINNDETMGNEIVARGGPKVFLEKPLDANPTGAPMEVIVTGTQNSPPVFHQGIGLPPALVQRREWLIENLQHAATLSQIQLGEVPPNADTYSALALLKEAESGKRSYIRKGHKRSIGTLMELGVYDINKYWPDEKMVMVEGDEDVLTVETFRKSQIPSFYAAKVAKGAPQPRSQAAELKKIDAIWAAAVNSGLAVQDPAAWTAWYVESINAGSAQEIPEPQTDSQTQMAEYENLLMRHGETVIPADYDLIPVHLPIHRAEQDRARAEDDMELFLRVQQHIDASVQVQQENAAKVAASQQQASPLASPASPAPAGPPLAPAPVGHPPLPAAA